KYAISMPHVEYVVTRLFFYSLSVIHVVASIAFALQISSVCGSSAVVDDDPTLRILWDITIVMNFLFMGVVGVGVLKWRDWFPGRVRGGEKILDSIIQSTASTMGVRETMLRRLFRRYQDVEGKIDAAGFTEVMSDLHMNVSPSRVNQLFPTQDATMDYDAFEKWCRLMHWIGGDW
ncbi:MAG: hypothetical protein MJA30_26475, partial [Cytophagales bacterium]|nr:hypothetical protein [Cytophagales bacterium]